MRYSIIAILMTVLVLLSGCGGMQGVPKKEIYLTTNSSSDIKIKAPAQKLPAKLVNPEVQLETSQYMKIGRISVSNLSKACFKGDCKNYDNHSDALSQLLKNAAFYGGTHFTLEEKNVLKRYPVSRDSNKCAIVKGDDFDVGSPTVYTASGQMVDAATQALFSKKGYCTSWSRETGQGEWQESAGTIWRYDPQAIRKLATIKEPNKYKVVVDKKTGTCGYIDPVFNAYVRWLDNFDSCSSFVKIQGEYYAYVLQLGDWRIINTDGIYPISSAARFGGCCEKPQCKLNDTKCVKQSIYKDLKTHRIIK